MSERYGAIPSCIDLERLQAVRRNFADDDFEAYTTNSSLEFLCYNDTGATLTKGTVVYISGIQGDKPKIVKADASTESTSSKVIGIIYEDIPNMEEGLVIEAGELIGTDGSELDTDDFDEGDLLWLSTTAGEITNVRPTQPDHSVFLGYCIRSHPNAGHILVNIQNGFEINELHDVLITTPTNGQVLAYESSTSLWKNVRRRRSLYQTGTIVEVEGDADDVLTVSIPAGLLSTDGDAVKASIFGANVDPTCTVEFWFGGTKRQSYDTLGGGTWSLDLELLRRSNTVAVGKFSLIGDDGAVVYLTSWSATSLNLTTTAYDFVIRLDSTAGDVINLQTATVEFLPAP